MARRLELQTLLEGIAPHVYFQPPPNDKMSYPCIRYNQDNAETDFADNKGYRHTKRYEVTVIDENPDTEISDKVAELPMCKFNRSFAADNLNHYVYTLYF